MIWWEDFKVGDSVEMGRHSFSAQEIVDFGRRFDRWPNPVRPGDTLVYRRTVLAARASSTRPGVGLVKHRWEAVNQKGELVLSMEGWGMFGRRP